ncbi:MAG: hypothetical protein ABI867_44060 [Kofleriaceae bacterium]
MVRHASLLAGLFVPLLLVSCGGGKKPTTKKPVVKNQPDDTPAPKRETEEDRDKKRHEAALAIVPDGTSCLPPSLKEPNAPRLQLAAVGSDAVICANDVDPSRLLGPVACWKVELADGGLVYQAANPLPGRNLTVKLDDHCARGFCLPKEAKVPADGIVHMAWNEDGSKAVVVAGDEVHMFDGTARARESGFSIRGDKGVSNEPTAVTWVGDAIFIEGSDAGPAAYVFGFKLDGTPIGPLTALGGKETNLSTHGGSFVVLDKNRVGVAEKGFSTVTTYEIDNGKRAKIVRTVTPGPCKKPEIDAYWNESGEVGAKCKDHLNKTYGHLIGADAVAGKTNLLVLLRGSRLGELAVLDAKNLNEKKTIKLPWCDGGSKEADKADKPKTRGATPKKPKPEDPDQGGE